MTLTAPRMLVASLLLATGCSSGPEEISSRLAQMPPARFAFRIVLPKLNGDGPDSALRLDFGRLYRALQAELDRTNACTSYTVVNEEEEVGSDSAVRGSADLELRVEATQPSHAFTRRTGWFVPNTLLWFLVGFPSFWVADRAYELDWDVSFALRLACTGRELRRVDRRLREERRLNVLERGWTAEVLYTPPGLHEGPRTVETLALRAEEWLVRRIVECLKEEAPRLPFEVVVDVTAEPDGAMVKVRSPTVLERLRVELDGAPVFERDALTMLKARRLREPGAGGETCEYSIHVPLPASPTTRLLRIFALRSGDANAGPASWSASQSIRLEPGS